ncbi:MAG: ROK family protein [Bacteroidales bacterium]|jgi:glucokinase
MKNEKIAIGVDVGGTKIRTGAVTIDGNILGNQLSVDTGAMDAKEVIVGRIIDSITWIMEQNDLEISKIGGIGLGVTGPLDVKNGKILQCQNLPTMDFFPMKDVIQKEFNLPVFMNNDANAMMLGESFWGAGKGFSSVLGITLGTGLGCALVLDKKIWMGATETAGEIWISPYKDGTIEDVVSGKGVSVLYEKLSGSLISASEVAARAFNGDPAAKATWDEFGKAVGHALAWSINLIDPEVVIVGGSIANATELFSPSMNEMLRKTICPIPAQNLHIVKAHLGDNAGFMGAAALVYC